MLLLLLSHFSHVRLCNPIDGSPPGSSVPETVQAKILEWVAIFFFNACMHANRFSHVQLCVIQWTVAHQIPLSRGFLRQEYWSENIDGYVVNKTWRQGTSTGNPDSKAPALKCYCLYTHTYICTEDISSFSYRCYENGL